MKEGASKRKYRKGKFDAFQQGHTLQLSKFLPLWYELENGWKDPAEKGCK